LVDYNAKLTYSSNSRKDEGEEPATGPGNNILRQPKKIPKRTAAQQHIGAGKLLYFTIKKL